LGAQVAKNVELGVARGFLGVGAGGAGAARLAGEAAAGEFTGGASFAGRLVLAATLRAVLPRRAKGARSQPLQIPVRPVAAKGAVVLIGEPGKVPVPAARAQCRFLCPRGAEGARGAPVCAIACATLGTKKASPAGTGAVSVEAQRVAFSKAPCFARPSARA